MVGITMNAELQAANDAMVKDICERLSININTLSQEEQRMLLIGYSLGMSDLMRAMKLPPRLH